MRNTESQILFLTVLTDHQYKSTMGSRKVGRPHRKRGYLHPAPRAKSKRSNTYDVNFGRRTNAFGENNIKTIKSN